MKQYILKQIGNNEPIGKYSNKADAVDDMDTIIADHNEDLDSDDDGFLTPFDFTLEVVECQDVNETITNFDEARAFLGGKPNNDYTVSKKVLSGNCVQLADVTHLVQDVTQSTLKHLSPWMSCSPLHRLGIRRTTLCLISQIQCKTSGFLGLYMTKGLRGSFVCEYDSTPSDTHASVGSRLCFKNTKSSNPIRQTIRGLVQPSFLAW